MRQLPATHCILKACNINKTKQHLRTRRLDPTIISASILTNKPEFTVLENPRRPASNPPFIIMPCSKTSTALIIKGDEKVLLIDQNILMH